MRSVSARSSWNRLDGLLAFGATGQLTDVELLARFVAERDAAGEAAFAALVERHGPMVVGVCRRVLGDRHEAEDAFQATFLVLARKAGSIARPQQLANWLFGVAHRTSLDARARAMRSKARERRAHAISRSHVRPTEADRLVLFEMRAVIDEELARLPERYRSALVLCELEGLTRRAAAQRLGIPEGTLSSRLDRAKNLLRVKLVRRGMAISAIALEFGLGGDVQARSFAAPFHLVDSTIRSATRVAAGAAVRQAASAPVATLVQGVLKTMLLAKVKGLVVALAGLAAVTTSFGVLAQAPSQVSSPEMHRTLKDSIAVARRPVMTTTTRLVLPGSTALDPTRLARIRARFAPARVVEIAHVRDSSPVGGAAKFRELRQGDRVHKGDPLATFYSRDVSSKKNDLLDALIQLDLDQRVLDEAEKHHETVPNVFLLAEIRVVEGDRNAINHAINNLRLWEIPQDEIDAVHAEAKKIKHARQANGAVVVLHGPQEERWGSASLRAPIDGVIVERSVSTGEMVLDRTANLFQIADVDSLLVLANCPEESLSDVLALSPDQRKWIVQTVGANPAAGLPGTIDEIGYVFDPKTHTAIIKGQIDNPGHQIRAGQYVTAIVDVPVDVVEIPANAVMEDGKQSLVLAAADAAKNQFAVRRVQVVNRLDGKVLVRCSSIPKDEQLTAAEAGQGLLPKEPLRPGERVLIFGGSEPVKDRLGALERKLDQVLDELAAQRRSLAPKP